MGDNITIHFNFSNLTTLGNHLKTSCCWESETKHKQNISKHILWQLFVPSSEWEALWEIVVVWIYAQIFPESLKSFLSFERKSFQRWKTHLPFSGTISFFFHCVLCVLSVFVFSPPCWFSAAVLQITLCVWHKLSWTGRWNTRSRIHPPQPSPTPPTTSQNLI